MPIEDDKTLQGDVPDGAHLALLTQSGGGYTRGIPITAAEQNNGLGARMLLVFDPEDPSKVWPVVLAKMNRYGLWFRCNCGVNGCKQVFRYKLTVENPHPGKGQQR
jgi:hypothetical protein